MVNKMPIMTMSVMSDQGLIIVIIIVEMTVMMIVTEMTLVAMIRIEMKTA